MKIDIETVRQVFRDVLDERMTREEANLWAYNIIKKDEEKPLVYSPLTDRDRIWEGLMYLYGIDNMEDPEQYLHSEEDIRLAMIKILGG